MRANCGDKGGRPIVSLISRHVTRVTRASLTLRCTDLTKDIVPVTRCLKEALWQGGCYAGPLLFSHISQDTPESRQERAEVDKTEARYLELGFEPVFILNATFHVTR